MPVLRILTAPGNRGGFFIRFEIVEKKTVVRQLRRTTSSEPARQYAGRLLECGVMKMSFSDAGFKQTAFVFALGVMLGATMVEAKPKISVVEKTYTVDATTARAMVQQMGQRGPNGYWAYTDWYVNWTGSCDLSVKITYTMPKHKNEAKLDPAVRENWKTFLAVLRKHEEKHGAHGIQAAQEIEQTKCADGQAVIKKWSNQDKVLDKRTDHGKKEGVVLK
ncbi:DUF922 domain-containing Zn-dependent protease [Ruegeria marisflavi]|nr:DUF922 domain-containing Zn-dependent protease [Ruegeria sp. WL0004]